MTTWDREVFGSEVNGDFLDELLSLEDEDVVETVRDVIVAAVSGQASEAEEENALAAATIAALWAGAPFSASDIVRAYPFIRDLAGSGDEELNEQAAEILQRVEDDHDVDAYIEALS
ncbi:DUF4259 domain-containing protein [Corynebacterium lizhenjunii]|uniref:DUF4259 domain-containing protein n=1 Tax=Corynebacterium lizhenjunii TaxID=2709394 RepID=UPI0013EB6DDE|nr:DUF4259 domain-containing protein [Corynebacterium lizhenjunii]